MPLIVQFNKRDVPDALPIAELKTALDVGKLPCFEAVAIKGVGVPQTLQAAIRYLLAYVQYNLKKQRTGVAQ